MHEVGLMSDALRLALDYLERNGGGRVTVMRMRVGGMSGVVSEALQFAFATLTPGTPAEGARLELEPVPVLWYCRTCRLSFEVQDRMAQCPGCAGIDVELRQGTEFELQSIEVD